MAVLRCPHCGKPNPDFLDLCQYCEKPLKATPPPASAGEAESPDWLRGLQSDAPDVPDWLKTATGDLPAQPQPAAPADDVPDWLKSLGGASQAAAQSEDVPDWLKTSTGPIAAEDTAPLGPTAPIADESQEAVPDWLKSLGATGPVGLPTEPLDTLPLPGTAPVRDTGAFTSAESAGEGLPDWLKSLGATGGMPVPPPPPAGNAPDWLKDLPSAPEPESETPDWLRSATGSLPEAGAPSEAAPPVEPGLPAGDMPDWLRTATGSLPEAGAPSEAAPPAEPGLPAGDMPDWLRTATGSLPEAGAPSEAAPPAEPGLPASDMPDWLRTATGPLTAAITPSEFAPPPTPLAPEQPPAEVVPDWLRSATGSLPEAGAPSEAAPPAEPGLPAGDMPDWLRTATGPLTAALTPSEFAPPPTPLAPEQPPEVPPSFGQPAQAEPAPVPPASEVVPDWLRLATESPIAPGAAPADEELPDWLRTATGSLVGRPAEPGAPKSPPTEPEGLPDWLKAATGPLTAALPAAALTPKPAPPPAPVPADVPGLEKGELPDWLRQVTGELKPPAPAEAPVAAAPPPPVAEPPPATTTAPFAAAPVLESEPDWLASLREEPPAAEPAVAGEEPDWLTALRPGAEEPEPEAVPAATPPTNLAQADLPGWLAAMRPVDVAPTGLERETDDYLESVGVLGGLRGVLRAEPSVVLPGKSATNIHLLNYTDAQSRQASLLGKLVAAEAAGAAAKPRRAWTDWPWGRWVVALVLLLGLALALPGLGLFEGLFPLPRTATEEVVQAYETVNALDPARPVLVAFDYEPGQAGEMTPLADVVVGHLIRRGVPIVAVSTQVTGAGVAEEELNRLTGAARGRINDYVRGVNYLNLGFLPGGPLGIRQLVQAPRTVARMGSAASGQLWDSALLSGVQSFNDFGAVVVLSHTPENARAWVEQTQGAAPSLVLVTSASAAPLVRPYFAGDQARIAGFLGGPAAAMQYDTLGGNVLAVEQERASWGRRWDMLGAGLLLVAGLLLFGNLFYGVRRALAQTRRGRAR